MFATTKLRISCTIAFRYREAAIEDSRPHRSPLRRSDAVIRRRWLDGRFARKRTRLGDLWIHMPQPPQRVATVTLPSVAASNLQTWERVTNRAFNSLTAQQEFFQFCFRTIQARPMDLPAVPVAG